MTRYNWLASLYDCVVNFHLNKIIQLMWYHASASHNYILGKVSSPAYWAWRCLSADFLLNYGFMHCCLLTKPSKLPSPIVALTISLISHYYFHMDILIALLLAFHFFQVFRPGFSDTICTPHSNIIYETTSTNTPVAITSPCKQYYVIYRCM